VKIEP